MPVKSLTCDQPRTIMPPMSDQPQNIEKELARLRQELDACRAEKAALEQAHYDQTYFISKLGHDFRNPLSSVIGLSEMLTAILEEEGNENLTGSVSRIRRAGLRLLGMIDNVCDLAKLDINRIAPKPSSFDVGPVIRHIIDELQDQADKNQNQVIFTCPPILPPLMADMTWFSRIIENLIANAVTFTEQGQVDISIEHLNDIIQIIIGDNGPGIPQDLKGNLFKGFVVTDGGKARKGKGTGLGLAICHRMVSAMKGSLVIESDAGKGTQVTLTLPLKPLA